MTNQYIGFWGLLYDWQSGIVGLFAVAVAWRQLAGIRDTSRADFTLRFVESFFTSETRTLLALMMNSALTFEIKDIVEGEKTINHLPYLKINRKILEQIAGIVMLESDKIGYSAFEVDDLLIGHFESLGFYVRKKLIDFDSAYSTFSYYLTETYKNPEIRKYLEHDDNNENYNEFRGLYKRFCSKRPCIS